jgi:hypothetical protein
MIIRTSLGDTCIGSISGHHHDNFGCYTLDNYVQTLHNYLINFSSTHVTIMKTFHNYLTISLFSPTHMDMKNKFTRVSHN